jgi:hypothetical protein
MEERESRRGVRNNGNEGDGVLKNSFLLAWRGGLVAFVHRLRRARVIEDVMILLGVLSTVRFLLYVFIF